jgi:hypothetical protein
MSARPFVVLTTRLPPQICGVGTYSWLAHKHWPEQRSDVQFIVMDGADASRGFLGINAITDFDGDGTTLLQILNRLGSADLLLHYAGRAYQRFGCPIWMPRALQRWKRQFPEARLTVFFHEVPGDLPITSRHFLFGKINRRIVRQLAETADALVTNTANHAAIVRELSGRNDVHCLPVGSNIELVASLAQPRAATEFVVFGLPFGRSQTLQLFGAEILRWHQAGLLTKLHLIGPEDQGIPNAITRSLTESGLLIPHGRLSDPDVSELLGRVRFALTNVTPETWSKSGAFMACAAHGCAVVIRETESNPPLSHAIAARDLETTPAAEIQQKAESLRQWYETHAIWSATVPRLAAIVHSRRAPS